MGRVLKEVQQTEKDRKATASGEAIARGVEVGWGMKMVEEETGEEPRLRISVKREVECDEAVAKSWEKQALKRFV